MAQEKTPDQRPLPFTPAKQSGPRPYTRCQGCGKRYPGARRAARCDNCRDGQQLLWEGATAPEGFEPVA